MINIIDIEIFQYSIVPLLIIPRCRVSFLKIFSFISTSPSIERTSKSLMLHYSEQNIDRSGSEVVGRGGMKGEMWNLSERPSPYNQTDCYQHFTRSAFYPIRILPIRILPYTHFTRSAFHTIRILSNPHFTQSAFYTIRILPNPHFIQSAFYRIPIRMPDFADFRFQNVII